MVSSSGCWTSSLDIKEKNITHSCSHLPCLRHHVHHASASIRIALKAAHSRWCCRIVDCARNLSAISTTSRICALSFSCNLAHLQARDLKGNQTRCISCTPWMPTASGSIPLRRQVLLVELRRMSPANQLLFHQVQAGEVTKSAHPARFSPDDKYSRHRVTLKKR